MQELGRGGVSCSWQKGPHLHSLFVFSGVSVGVSLAVCSCPLSGPLLRGDLGPTPFRLRQTPLSPRTTVGSYSHTGFPHSVSLHGAGTPPSTCLRSSGRRYLRIFTWTRVNRVSHPSPMRRWSQWGGQTRQNDFIRVAVGSYFNNRGRGGGSLRALSINHFMIVLEIHHN